MTDNVRQLRELIAAERRELADTFASLSVNDWNHPSLCEGWRVHEVVAHMTMPFHFSLPRFALGMLKARGNFNRMADQAARRDAVRFTPAELAQMMRDNVNHPWKPLGSGYDAALSHDVIHGLDITVALNMDRRVPEERLRTVLAGAGDEKTRKYFGVDLDGVELRASDIDWSLGSGAQLVGIAQDLLLVVCGRKLPAGHLEGAPSARFTVQSD